MNHSLFTHAQVVYIKNHPIFTVIMFIIVLDTNDLYPSDFIARAGGMS